MDLTGLIFFPRSPRFVSLLLPPKMPKSSKRVGVFVNSTVDDMIQKAKEYALYYIQLHGSESPELLKRLHRTAEQEGLDGLRLIKAFNISSEEDLALTKQYEGTADLFLFDTKTEHAGGSGRKFDWSVLNAYDGITKFLLSGGIGPGDEEEILTFHHPMIAGIDLNSRFEQEPGIKDISALSAFLNGIRACYGC